MSRERLPVVLAASVVVLLLSACSNGDDANPFPTSTVPTTSGTVATPEGTAEPTGTAAPVASTEPASGDEATSTVEATTAPTLAPTQPAATSTATPAAGIPRPVGFVEALGGRVFVRPIELGAYPGGRLFVAKQDGGVFLFDADGSNQETLIGLGHTISRDGNEEGLLSVALDPNFEANNYLWAYYSAAGPRRTVLARYTVSPGEVDFSSEVIVLEVAQPFSNHNGGAIRFGPDGMLYLGLGDGGSANDPLGSGQDRSTLLGSVIRIDVRNASASAPYVVPADNPFVGEANVRAEIWAYGIRNPWRMSFDPTTGALWLGDVGQGAVEEVSVIRRGENYGWDITEGNICHEPSSGCSTTGITFPVATYGHSGGRCSISGGVVYRGSSVSEIAASYLYGDFCSGEVWAMSTEGSSAPIIVASDLGNIASFGVDAAGDVYVLRFGQSIVRLVSP